MIFNLKFRTKTMNKYWKAMGGKLFMEYHLIFSRWKIAFVIPTQITLQKSRLYKLVGWPYSHGIFDGLWYLLHRSPYVYSPLTYSQVMR